jgi:hypothetical protein
LSLCHRRSATLAPHSRHTSECASPSLAHRSHTLFVLVPPKALAVDSETAARLPPLARRVSVVHSPLSGFGSVLRPAPDYSPRASLTRRSPRHSPQHRSRRRTVRSSSPAAAASIRAHTFATTSRTISAAALLHCRSSQRRRISARPLPSAPLHSALLHTRPPRHPAQLQFCIVATFRVITANPTGLARCTTLHHAAPRCTTLPPVA